MWSTPLPLLPDPLWPRVVAPYWVLSIGQTELDCVLMLNWIVWNKTVNMYKNGFGINNLQWLMCHKTKPECIRFKKNLCVIFDTTFFYSTEICFTGLLGLCTNAVQEILGWIKIKDELVVARQYHRTNDIDNKWQSFIMYNFAYLVVGFKPGGAI